jgi:microcystin-dependent protein
MADPYVAEIRMVGFNFAPRGWALCNGQLMSISQNTALFSLLGTQYGGNGQTTFALPNLQGAAPMHQGQGPGLTDRVVGELGGSGTVTLNQSEMPAHNHTAMANAEGATSSNPQNTIWTTVSRTAAPPYGPATNLQQMSPMAIAVSGGSQAHTNMQPYLTVNFVIALEGVFPPRS